MSKGVTHIPERYRARVKFLGKYMFIGYYTTEGEAKEKVSVAESVISEIEAGANKEFAKRLQDILTSRPPVICSEVEPITQSRRQRHPSIKPMPTKSVSVLD